MQNLQLFAKNRAGFTYHAFAVETLNRIIEAVRRKRRMGKHRRAEKV